MVQRTLAHGSCGPNGKLNVLTCHAWTRTDQTTLLTNVLLSYHWNTFLLMWHFCDRQDCDHFSNHLPVFYFTSLSVLKDDSHIPSRQPVCKKNWSRSSKPSTDLKVPATVLTGTIGTSKKGVILMLLSWQGHYKFEIIALSWFTYNFSSEYVLLSKINLSCNTHF